MPSEEGGERGREIVKLCLGVRAGAPRSISPGHARERCASPSSRPHDGLARARGRAHPPPALGEVRRAASPRLLRAARSGRLGVLTPEGGTDFAQRESCHFSTRIQN
ncbi:uncharacterized protein LOC120889065 [Ictidomys tridecemlineatus]